MRFLPISPPATFSTEDRRAFERRACKTLLLTLLGVVILGGESMKVNGVNIAGLVLMALTGCLAVMVLRGAGLGLRGVHLWIVGLLVLFASVGAIRYPAGDVFEDALPFVIFLVVTMSLAHLAVEDHVDVARIVIFFAAAAVAKVLAIRYLDVEPAWGGNTFWQGARFDHGGVTRVILKGADVFVGLSATLLWASLMLRPRLPRLFPSWLSVLLLTALCTSVMMSNTRATIGAIVAATVLAPLVLWPARGVDWRRAAGVIVVVLLLTVLAFRPGSILSGRFPGGMSAWASTSLQQATDGAVPQPPAPAAAPPATEGQGLASAGTAAAQTMPGPETGHAASAAQASRASRATAPVAVRAAPPPPSSDFALTFRQAETRQALAVARRDRLLGSGFGAHYYVPASGSSKDDGRSLYVHILPVWLLLKVGAVGAALFYLVIAFTMVMSIRRIRHGASTAATDPGQMLLAIGLIGVIFLSLNDLLNNKFATASGAAAYGLALWLGATALALRDPPSHARRD